MFLMVSGWEYMKNRRRLYYSKIFYPVFFELNAVKETAEYFQLQPGRDTIRL
jgi:hypothetical protein